MSGAFSKPEEASVPAAPPVRAVPAIAVLCTALWVLYRLFPSQPVWEPLLLEPARFSPLSMFTAPFIHLTAGHLGTNLLFLGLFGPPLERRLGSGLFLLLYLGAGLLAALLHLSIALGFQIGLNQYAHGASGAIAGLMGAYTVLNIEPPGQSEAPIGRTTARGVGGPGSAAGRRAAARPGLWRALTWRRVLLSLVVVWIFAELLQGALNLLSGGESVAHWAHIGGFLFGLIIMVAMGQGTWTAEQLLDDGRQLLHKGRYPEAERMLERAWSLQPHDPAIVICLARAKQALGSGETARELLAAAIEQEVRDGRPERAVPLYLEARALAPRLRLSQESHFRVGAWLIERGAWEEACAALERAAGPSRGAGGTRESLSGPTHRESSPAPAAVPRGPEDPVAATALYRAAEVAWMQLHQPERAVTLLERLLAEQPRSQWRALAERSLRQLRLASDGEEE